MKSLKMSWLIKAKPELVWQALTDPKLINKWGGGPAKMNDREGSAFSFWGGDITGKNIKVVKGKKLVQDWQEADWDEPSNLTVTLKAEKSSTRVELLQSGLPAGRYADIKEGWQEYYFGPLKELVEQMGKK